MPQANIRMDCIGEIPEDGLRERPKYTTEESDTAQKLGVWEACFTILLVFKDGTNSFLGRLAVVA